MNAIIFSKNRALQLDALLRSMYLYCDIFSSITVLYTTEYKTAYRLLAEEHPFVDFVEEQNFKEDFLILVSASRDNVCLLVDDDMFFKEVDLWELNEMLQELDIASLRLGENVTKELHFNYKSSLDGNIFPRETLERLEREDFNNPNQLEVKLKKHTDHLSMGWFNEQKLIGFPFNKVSDTSTCDDMGISLDQLNDYYLQGVRIDLEKMDYEETNVHKYTELKLC